MGDGIRIDNQRLTPWHSLIDLRCGRMQKFWCFDIRTIYRIQNFSLFYFSSFLFLITRFLLFNVRFQRNTRSHCFRFVPRGRNYVLVWALLFLFTRSVFSQRKKLFSSGQTFFRIDSFKGICCLFFKGFSLVRSKSRDSFHKTFRSYENLISTSFFPQLRNNES